MSVAGTWRLVVDSPMGKQDVSIDIAEEGGLLTGTLVNNTRQMSGEILDGRVEGDQYLWKVKLQRLPTLSFTTTVDGDTMSGKVKAGVFGSFDLHGERG